MNEERGAAVRKNDMLHEATLRNYGMNSNGQLVGRVFGHPNFEDGTLVTTSTVRYYNAEEGIAVTHNTVYFLGKKHE